MFKCILIVSILLFTAVLLKLSLREDLWGDEGFTMRRIEAAWPQVYYPFSFRPRGSVDPFDLRFVYDFNPPLYFSMIRAISGPKPTPLTVRFYSMLSMMLVIALLSIWSWRHLGKWAGYTMVGLAITNPILIYYGHEARPYALGLLFAVCMIVSLFQKRLTARWLFAACVMGTTAGCLTHFAFGWFVVAYALVLIVAAFRASKLSLESPRVFERRRMVWGLTGLGVGASLALAVIYPQREIFSFGHSIASREMSVNVLMHTMALPLGGVGHCFLFPQLPFMLQIAILGLCFVMLMRSNNRWLGLMALIFWLVPLVLPIMAKLILGLAFYERYAFFSLPGWLMALAWLAHEIATRRIRHKWLLTLPFILLFTSNLAWCTWNLSHPMRQSLRPLIRHLLQQAKPTDGYTIEPDWLNICFAANAQHPPEATYFHAANSFPNHAQAVWIIACQRIDLFERYHLDPRQWHASLSFQQRGAALWRLTRNRDPAKE